MNITLLRQFNDESTWLAIDEDSGVICLRRLLSETEAELYIILYECQFPFAQKILSIAQLENGTYELFEEYLWEKPTRISKNERKQLNAILSEVSAHRLQYNVSKDQLFCKNGSIILANEYFYISARDSKASNHRFLATVILVTIIIIAVIIALVLLDHKDKAVTPTSNIETTTDITTELSTTETIALTEEATTTFKPIKINLSRASYCEQFENERFVFSGEGIIDNSFFLPGMELWHNCKEIVVEDGITQIGGTGFFSGCSDFTIELPNSLQIIGTAAFKQCHGFEIVIPSSVEAIHEAAFYGCKNAIIHIPKTAALFGVKIFDEIENDEIIYY